MCILLQKGGKMARIIGIVSGKGGVGKTTTTINLSAALMSFKRSVVAIDADVKCLVLDYNLECITFHFH